MATKYYARLTENHVTVMVMRDGLTGVEVARTECPLRAGDAVFRTKRRRDDWVSLINQEAGRVIAVAT